MLLVTPPDDVIEAVSPVAVKVCTRDRAVSKFLQPDGFLSPATTRNSTDVLWAGVAGADVCVVVHPAVTAVAIISAQSVPVE